MEIYSIIILMDMHVTFQGNVFFKQPPKYTPTEGKELKGTYIIN